MPLGPAEYAIVLADSSALRIPSDEVASIFGAPARIATPMPDDATLTRLSGTSLPCLIRSSIWAAGSMTTSATSPSPTRFHTGVSAAPGVASPCPGAVFVPRPHNEQGAPLL